MPVSTRALLITAAAAVLLLAACTGGSGVSPTTFPTSAAFPTGIATLPPLASATGSATASATGSATALDNGSATPGASGTAVLGASSTPSTAPVGATPGVVAPATTSRATITASGSATAAAGGASQSSNTYTVKAGDTVGSIAQQFGVTTADLVAANNLSDPNSIIVGQVLKIPPPSPSTAASSTPTISLSTPPRGSPTSTPTASSGSTGSSSSPGTYTVQVGDTACQIARTYNVNLADLAGANATSIDALSTIVVGQVLKISPPSAGGGGC